ncbi:hypothetical protein TraAM80_02087 [Trypanosoma rangeli]|uniref:Uncharacterized protein n=1 Tax=Trypanosoma rangeli TaxID=5698 RepID=A0A422NVV4_TRYRA|nr:uncharacterized protein TraAM80_02087 [Trypanosoma rangeli]RNF09603.1 hypothetical protein TraAM80_02087 [Trypanosoma rangeli]|eukprot:RNF09603.1 hypothetical protein TraAM80_02087 [Trypanosoma rangeli]
MEQTCLDLQGLGISSFWGIKETDVEYVTIDLRNNALRSFEHFGTHPKLVELRLQNNQIKSLMGLTKQPLLAVVDLDGNPIASHPWYRVMALLVVGFSITTIDGVAVSTKEREMAQELGPIAALAVSYGWKLQPGERSPEEYRQIIDECKRVRKCALQQHQGSFHTIELALKQYKGTETLLSSALNETSMGNDSSAWSLEFLSERVKELENSLSEAREQLEVQQARWRESVDLGYVEGITGAELGCARSILFTDGIYLRTNTMDSPPHGSNGQTRGSVMFEGSSLVLLSFMSRVRLAESALCNIKVEYCPPSSLRVEGAYGAAFEILFEHTLSLWCVYKLLYLRRGIPVPPLHLRDRVEGDAMLRKVTTTQLGLENTENSGIPISFLNEKNEPHGENNSPQEFIGTVMSLSSERRSLPEVELPPGDLPSPGIRSVQMSSDTKVSPVENVLQGKPLEKRSSSRSVSDFPALRQEEHMEASCNTLEELRATSWSVSRSRPSPPSRLPRRSCSRTSPPPIPKRHPSSAGNTAVLENLNVIGGLANSHEDDLCLHIQRFRMLASDSDSDSDSDSCLLRTAHSERRL